MVSLISAPYQAEDIARNTFLISFRKIATRKNPAPRDMLALFLRRIRFTG